MSVCAPCRNGDHRHDRFTGTGVDAGCPHYVPDSLDFGCTCPVRLPTIPPPRHCPTCRCTG